MFKRFVLYLFRWQLSTPILWLAVKNLGVGIWATIIANLIGGAIFFWVDRFIFTSQAVELWHLKDKDICFNCGREAMVWRLIKAKNYDRTTSVAKFLCRDCSRKKISELKKEGISVSHIPH